MKIQRHRIGDDFRITDSPAIAILQEYHIPGGGDARSSGCQQAVARALDFSKRAMSSLSRYLTLYAYISPISPNFVVC